MYQHACMETCLSQCFFLRLLRFIFLFFLLQFLHMNLLFTTCLHHASSLYASSYISIFMLRFMLLDLHTYTSHYAPVRSRAIRRLLFFGWGTPSANPSRLLEERQAYGRFPETSRSRSCQGDIGFLPAWTPMAWTPANSCGGMKKCVFVRSPMFNQQQWRVQTRNAWQRCQDNQE